MAPPRPVVVGIVLTVLLFLLGAFFFVQTQDPMMLFGATPLVAIVWTVVLVLVVLQRGIPVRLVDERRK